MTSCPSFQRAASHCLALGSVGAMPHSSSAAGHRPKRNMTRAASAAACVPTCAPFEANGGRADRRHPARIARRGVLRRLVHRVGVAGGDERKRAEGVDLRDRDFIGHAAQMGRHPVGQRRPDAVAHLDVIAVDGDPALRIDFHRRPASSPRRCRNSWWRKRRRCRRGSPLAARALSPRRAAARSDASPACPESPACGPRRCT